MEGLPKWKAPAPGAWSEGHQALLREVNRKSPSGQQGENPKRTSAIAVSGLGRRTCRLDERIVSALPYGR
jgi:hypothetical protein